MLKIKPIRATLGKAVTAKLKNTKDDQERVIEFKVSQLSLTQQQLSDLVACNKHERKFAEVAYVSRDSMSELRHFKKLLMASEVYDAVITIEKVGGGNEQLELHSCSMKEIGLSFTGGERTEISCKIWAPINEHHLYTLGAWGSEDIYISVTSKNHGKEEQTTNQVLEFPDKK